MQKDVFVTEVTGLHPTVVRGIHQITRDGSFIRIFTFDRRQHEGGVEHQVNGDFLIDKDDLLVMLKQVYEHAMLWPEAAYHREIIDNLREKRH